jgi:hypothetical protein
MILFYNIGLLELISATTNGKILRNILKQTACKRSTLRKYCIFSIISGVYRYYVQLSPSDIPILEFIDVINDIYSSCGKNNLDYIRKIMGMQLKLKENAFFKITDLF